MPTDYTLRRRIGSIPRESAALLLFTQLGDEFLRKVPVLDVNTTNPGTSAVTSTLLVPVGVKVRAYVAGHVIDGTPVGISAWVSSLDQTDTAASTSVMTALTTSTSPGSSFQTFVRTSVAAQIRYRFSLSDGLAIIRISTHGWLDTRGR